jgi:hypothetical protein
MRHGGFLERELALDRGDLPDDAGALRDKAGTGRC